MFEDMNVHKHEILHLMIWLSGQPPEQSVGYIREALLYCMKKMDLSEEEVNFFAQQVKMEDVVLGDRLPDDEKVKEVYKTFMGYLLMIKNQ